MNILIIGGYGAFGSFYAKLFKKNKFNVFIKGNNIDETKEFCEKNGFELFDENYSKINTIIISVPNKIAPSIIKEISNKAVKGTLICDFCSVKTFVVEELKKLKNMGFELASLHPMHGPRISSIANYPLIIIEIETGKNYEKLINFFINENITLINSTSDEHDKVLSVVQGLTHYSQIVSAETIKEIGVDLKKTKEFSSPNFELFISLMSRVLLQNPALYSQIQTENPFNLEMREIFSNKANELKEIAKDGNNKEIENEILKSSEIFNSTDNILINSDLAVSALKFVENTLREHIGKKFLVENISTHNFHYGVIMEVNNKEVKIDEGKIKISIAISKIRLTTKKEMFNWKKNNILEKHLDYSFFIPKSTTCDFIANIFNNLKIAKFVCIDEFENDKFPDDKKSITLRANFFSDDDKEKINDKINQTITGLGFEKR